MGAFVVTESLGWNRDVERGAKYLCRTRTSDRSTEFASLRVRTGTSSISNGPLPPFGGGCETKPAVELAGYYAPDHETVILSHDFASPETSNPKPATVARKESVRSADSTLNMTGDEKGVRCCDSEENGKNAEQHTANRCR